MDNKGNYLESSLDLKSKGASQTDIDRSLPSFLQPIQRERQAQQYEQERQAPQQPQAQAPDPKAEDWAERNEWFGKDQAMTYAAFCIHKSLVEDEKFDPSSDEYYNELDKRIAAEFPHKLCKS